MNRSQSTLEFKGKRIDRSQSQRAIYINEETAKREVATIFHSPYKDGRPNRDYQNPSFVSSHLFYPKEEVDKNNSIVCKKNIVPNRNDQLKELLYQQRLRKEQNCGFWHAPRKFVNKTERRHSKEKGKGRLDNREDRLRSELEVLRNYRQNIAQRSRRQFEASNKWPRNQTPVYLQVYIALTKKHRKDTQYQQQAADKQRNELAEWLAITNDLKGMKKSFKKEIVNQENINVEKDIRSLETQKVVQIQKQRNKAELLANILQEQIRTNQLRRP